jgi:hypothetical protein
MSREDNDMGASGETVAPSQALAVIDPEVALSNAATLWVEQNPRPETLARAEKLRDEVSAVTSFFDFAKKHPGEVTPEDVFRWRAEMERRGLKPATVYARICGSLVIKYRRKGGKFTAREVSDPAAYEALGDYLEGVCSAAVPPPWAIPGSS